VKFPSEAERSIFMILDCSAMPSLDSSIVRGVAALAFSREGRKKGAFSGAFGGSIGLFRCCVR
jgi:transcriptional regulator of aromatic amino acid metabolism